MYEEINRNTLNDSVSKNKQGMNLGNTDTNRPSTPRQILWERVNMGLRRNFIAVTTFIRKRENKNKSKEHPNKS